MTHVRHVLAFVDLVAGELPFDDALDIYVRILRLTPEQARNVGSRALAELGRREREGDVSPGPEEGSLPRVEREDSEEQHESPRAEALFSKLRRRVRGRVHEDLRHRINLAAARTEDSLLETHVENGLIFIRALGRELSEAEAVELYLDTMMLPEGTADVIYHRALREIADEVLPPLPSVPGSASVERAEARIAADSERITDSEKTTGVN